MNRGNTVGYSSIPLEGEIRVGDMIASRLQNRIYTIIGETRVDYGSLFKRILKIHLISAGNKPASEIFDYECYTDRRWEPFVPDGEYLALGKEKHP